MTLDDDPYLWLEDISGDKSLAWAREQNARSMKELEGVRGFTETRDRIKAILDSKDKIPWAAKRAKYLFNFWQDDVNPRGLWRRTTLAEYRKPKPKWEVVLDVDALGKAENESWVWEGSDCLYPSKRAASSRCRAAAPTRRRARVRHRRPSSSLTGRLHAPRGQARHRVEGPRHCLRGTDFGPGSLTDSGYARIVKEWKRGTPLPPRRRCTRPSRPTSAWAPTASGITATCATSCSTYPSFFSNDLLRARRQGAAKKIEKPDDATVSFWDDQVLVQLRSDWTHWHDDVARGIAARHRRARLSRGQARAHLAVHADAHDVV